MKTTNKKWLIIAAIVVVVILLGVWLYKRNNTDTSDITAITPNATASADQAIKTKVVAKMNAIKNDTQWYGTIKAGAVADGYTVNQALAMNAIWALKHDGDIPVDTYGAGENGHAAYVKANY